MYQDFCIRLAQDSGEVIRKAFALGMKKEYKDDHTPVTEADYFINRMVIERINAVFPNHDILGEEESDRSRGSRFVWLCDPIDGTIPFSHGIPTCVFSLALVDDGKPIVGVIYDPFLDRMYYAEKGCGAFLNGKRIHVSQRSTMQGSIVALTGTSQSFKNGKLYDVLRDSGLRIINLYTGIYEGALVGAGELLGVVLGATTPHDAASLKILVEEAGGRVTDGNGDEQRYDQAINDCIVSNGLVHNQLVAFLKTSKE